MRKTLVGIIIFLMITQFLCGFSSVYGVDKDGNTPAGSSLTKLQKDYLIAYTKYYVEQAHALNTVVYDDTDWVGYRNTYTQNDGSGLPRGYSGKNKSGKSYSNKLVLVCSVFTAAMLHQALGVDVDCPRSDGSPGYRGSSYASPRFTNSKGQAYFIAVPADGYLEVGDVISCAGYSQHSMLYLGYDEGYGGHIIAETGGGQTIQIRRMGSEQLYRSSEPITLTQARKNSGYIHDCLTYGEASRLNPEIISSDWKVPNTLSIKWQTGTTQIEYTPVYEPDDGHEHEWELKYNSLDSNQHIKVCKLCKTEEPEDCTFEYTSINDEKHKATCKCGKNIEEEHTFVNGVCTKCKLPEPIKIVLGDANLDGQVTPTDALAIKKHIVEITLLEGEAFTNADVDGNGSIGGTDLLLIKQMIIDI